MLSFLNYTQLAVSLELHRHLLVSMLDKLIRLSHLLFISVSKHLFILTDEKGKFDELVQDKDVKILIDPKALMHVIGTKMDFVDDKLRYQQLQQSIITGKEK